MRTWSIAAVIAGLALCTFVNAQDQVYEFNDFSAGKGKWQQVDFGGGGTVSVVDGWLRIAAGSTGDVSEGIFTPLGVFFPVPSSDCVFMTRFRQSDYAGGHHWMNRSVMIINTIATPANLATIAWATTLIGTDIGGQLDLYEKTPKDVYAIEDKTGTFTPVQTGTYVKITKVISTFTYYVSADSITWSKLAAGVNGAYKYFGLIDTWQNGWTEYDFAKITVLAGSGVAPRARPTGPRAFSLLKYNQGYLSVRLSSNVNQAYLDIYNIRGERVLSRIVRSGTNDIPLLLANGTYAAQINGDRSLFSVVRR